MKKEYLLIIMLFLGDAPSAQNLSLNVQIDSIYSYGLTKKFFSLEVKALKDTVIPDLETAYLEFNLYREEEIYSPPYLFDYYSRGGPGRTIMQPGPVGSGTEEYVYIETPQNFVELPKGRVLKKSFDMVEIFNRILPLGKFTIVAKYENDIKIKSSFNVTVNYKILVPKIINDIDQGLFYKGQSVLHDFYYLLGYPTTFVSGGFGPDSLHYQQAPILRAWWEDHKELILKVESVLNRVQYKGMRYENRVPKLLKKLEKGEYQERLEARNELYEIVGKPEWKPLASDIGEESQARVKELVDWWKENKGLVNWVNRVIVENQSK